LEATATGLGKVEAAGPLTVKGAIVNINWCLKMRL
jgi:hypothetical protein